MRNVFEHPLGAQHLVAVQQVANRAPHKRLRGLAEDARGGGARILDLSGFADDQDQVRSVLNQRSKARLAEPQLAVEALQLARHLVEGPCQLRQLIVSQNVELLAELSASQCARSG